MSEQERVIVTTNGRDYPGTVRYRGADGDPYVVLDQGTQGTFPAGRVRPYENKDAAVPGLERK